MCTYLKNVYLKSGGRSCTLSQIVINNAECRCLTRNNMLPIFSSAELSQSSIFNTSHFDWFRNWFNFIIASIRTNDPNQFWNFLIRFMIAAYRFYAPSNSHQFWLWSIIHISHKTMFFLSLAFSRFFDIDLTLTLTLWSNWNAFFEIDAAATGCYSFGSTGPFSSTRFLICIRYG